MSEKRVIAFDCETFRIGPGAIAPKMVCVTIAMLDENGEMHTLLTGNGDECVVDDLRELFEPGHMLVGLNTAYDLLVIAESYPELEPMIWKKLEAGEVDDVSIREMLLNLSTTGMLDEVELPDGSVTKIFYGMKALALKHLGVDLEDEKDDPNSPRLNFFTMDGLPAAHYDERYSEYAVDDARYTLEIYEEQEGMIESENGYASCSTSTFHTAADFALFCITNEGMAVDHEEVERMRDWLAEELSPEKHAPLYAKGILEPPLPHRPFGNQLKKAAAIVEARGGKVWEEEIPHTPTEAQLRKAKEKGVEPPTTKKIWVCDDWGPHLDALREGGVRIADPQKEKRKDEPLRAHVKEIADRVGYALKLTDGGAISTDKEVIGDLEDLDPLLKIYGHRQKLQKLVSTDLPRMEWPKGSGQFSDVVHFPFNILVKTTRTSSRTNDKYPSGNGQQVHPKVRGCFVPRPGNVLCSVDYSSLELVCVAEITYNLFGEESVHWQKVNADYNMHAFLGAQLAASLDPEFSTWCEDLGIDLTNFDDVYGAFMLLKKENPEFFGAWRKLAKPTGLGFPGGLGPKTMLEFAKNNYGVNFITIAEDRAEEHPEEFDEPTKSVLWHANDLYEMKPADFEWNPTLRGIQLASLIRDNVWHATYPEMRPYFKHISDDCVDEVNPVIGHDEESGREIAGLCYTTPLGMFRAACSFTACANGKAMQSPAAEGAKNAVFNAVRAVRDATRQSILYGCRVVNFVHDELIFELPDEGPDSLHDRATEIQRIMEDSMSVVIKNTKVKTEAALMRRWKKEADPVFDAEGRLTIWEEEPVLA